MKIKQLFYILLIAAMLNITACHLFEDDPPPEKEKVKAKGIFDIYLNGELFDINGINFFQRNPDVSYTELSGGLRIFAENRVGSQYFHFSSEIQEINTTGIDVANLLFFAEERCDLEREYILVEDGKDFLEFTELDKENDIIVGSFGFTLVDTCVLDTILVEGIFDTHYTL